MRYMHSQFRSVKSALIEQRQVYRHPVQIQRAAIRENGKGGAAAKAGELVDVSVYGCRVSCDGRFKASTRLWLRFDNSNPIPATAVWCKDGYIGCRFDEKLDQGLFRSLTLMSE